MTGQVSRMEGYTANGEMGLVGYVIAAGVALILLPVLPLVALLWLVAEAGDDRQSDPHRDRQSAG